MAGDVEPYLDKGTRALAGTTPPRHDPAPALPLAQWVVSAWWLLHSDQFNEFVNEEDYEDSDYKLPPSKGKKASGSSAGKAKAKPASYGWWSGL